MAGLLDTYLNTNNVQALNVTVKMAAFVKGRVDRVIATRGWGWWETCLQVEFGGMNEAAYNLCVDSSLSSSVAAHQSVTCS
jgi:hypothetical protein